MKVKPKPIPLTPEHEQRFWANVAKTTEKGCWLWTSHVVNGYGRISLSGSSYYAHRISFVIAGKNVPDELELDHLCRNRRCVNPDHLEAVDHRTNMLRGDGAGRANASKTHCHRGHPLSGENLVIYTTGKRRCRRCRICVRENGRRSYAKQQSAARSQS